jgi:phosphatidylglycerophosphatase A
MPLLTPLPQGLKFSHPAAWLATWFGSGLLPKIPGTWGSLAALPFAWVIQSWAGNLGLVVAAAAAFAVGCWASAEYMHADGSDDPGMIVIDEVAGMWLTLAIVPQILPAYLIAFVLFRFFDMLKPWPIRAVERRFKGAFGVMIDDIAAALFAMAVIWLINAVQVLD